MHNSRLCQASPSAASARRSALAGRQVGQRAWLGAPVALSRRLVSAGVRQGSQAGRAASVSSSLGAGPGPGLRASARGPGGPAPGGARAATAAARRGGSLGLALGIRLASARRAGRAGRGNCSCLAARRARQTGRPRRGQLGRGGLGDARGGSCRRLVARGPRGLRLARGCVARSRREVATPRGTRRPRGRAPGTRAERSRSDSPRLAWAPGPRGGKGGQRS